MFGDKKTMWCHHLTKDGKLSVREAQAQGKTFKTQDEVWEFIGKLVCGPCIKADH